MTKKIDPMNVGTAINRKFKKVDSMDDKIYYLQSKIKLMEKAKNDMEEGLLARLEHQSNYLISLEKRIEKLETQPSIDGERLLKTLEDLNSKVIVIDDPGKARYAGDFVVKTETETKPEPETHYFIPPQGL